MERSTNALTELAERLEVEAKFAQENGRNGRPIYDASRIVAELAKVIDCKEPERIMPLDKPYDDITIYAPYDNGLTESNSINEDEQRFILDLANAAWNCRAIAEEGENND